MSPSPNAGTTNNPIRRAANGEFEEESLAQQIQSFREHYDLNVTQLARALGVSRQAIWRWESRAARPHRAALARLAELRSVSETEIRLRCGTPGGGVGRQTSSDYPESFGARLRRLRYERGISTRRIANAVGVTRQAVWKW